jgi:hypothetical protein
MSITCVRFYSGRAATSNSNITLWLVMLLVAVGFREGEQGCWLRNPEGGQGQLAGVRLNSVCWLLLSSISM